MESKDALISVIIPVYNVEKYLERCIDSVISQTYRNLEIILVDDGSTDGSAGICDAYAKKDARIKVIHKKNGGLSSARNSGLAVASGEYIGFVDSDDYIARDMYALMHGHMGADVDMASCRTVHMDKGCHGVMHGAADKMLLLDNVQAVYDVLHTRHLSNSSCDKLYKKKALGEIRFPAGRTSEDIPFVYNAVKNCRSIVHIGEGKYFYCHREGSISRRPFFKRRMDYVLFARDIWKDTADGYPMLRKAAEAKYVLHIMAIAKSIKESPNRGEYEYMRKRLAKAVRRMLPRIIFNPEMTCRQKLDCIAFK